MKLVDLVPLKEGSMQARELADYNSLEELQAMYDQLMRDMEQEAEPEGGPIADMYGQQMQDIEDAMQMKRGKSKEMTYGDMLHKNYPDKYGPGGVALDKDTFTKSSKFDRMNEVTEKSWNAVDVSRKAEKEISHKEWNERTAKKLDMLKKLNDAGKFKKDFDDERLEGWVDQNYSWQKLSKQFKLNEDNVRKVIRKIIKEQNFDDKLKSFMGADDFEKATNPKLSKLISNSIATIDPEMSYVDFAKGVAQVLIDEYGTHNYEPFIKELKKSLDSTLG